MTLSHWFIYILSQLLVAESVRTLTHGTTTINQPQPPNLRGGLKSTGKARQRSRSAINDMHPEFHLPSKC